MNCLHLPWLYFKVKLFSFRESRQIRRGFPGFIPFEKAIRRAYRLHNPYRICKEFLRQKGEKNIDAYGETPLHVFAQIAEQIKLHKEDVVIELGCGRGRGAFFLSHLVGCKVIGIDWVPFFIHTATSLAKKTVLQVSFRCEEMHTADFAHATVIYLYGTCLADEEILALSKRLEKLPPSTKIITVSYPLSDYNPRFKTFKQFTASFPWGDAEIYLNLKRELQNSIRAQTRAFDAD